MDRAVLYGVHTDAEEKVARVLEPVFGGGWWWG